MTCRPALPRLFLAVLLATTVPSCGDGGTPPATGAASIEVAPAAGLIVGLGEQLRFTADVTAHDGSAINDPVTWSSSDPAVVTIDAAGNATGVSVGRTQLTAQAGTAQGTASVEVYVSPQVAAYVPGQRYAGRNDYSEYFAGDLPVILSAPHGGNLHPSEIPDRTYGSIGADRNTHELTLALAQAIRQRTGGHPHVIINRLHRVKHDANREIVEAAQGSPFADQAWSEYHDFIDIAKATVTSDVGMGLLLDIHGHAHPVARIELGYLLSSADLNGTEASLDALVAESSVRDLASRVGIPFSQLIRGPDAFGTLLAGEGYRSVPSIADLGPGAEPYFTGGYITRRHGSHGGGSVSAIQLEHQFPGLRDTEPNRAAYVPVLVDTLERYLLEHYGIDWAASSS